MTRGRENWKIVVRSALAVVGFSIAASSASAQLLYSFEPDLQGWALTGFGGSDAVSVSHSTVAPTEGTHSMAVERGRAIGDSNPRSWDVNHTVSTGPIYDAYVAAASDYIKWAIDFDVTFTPAGWAAVTSKPSLFTMQIGVNGSPIDNPSNNFDQVEDLVPVGETVANLMTVQVVGEDVVNVPKYGTFHYRVPLASSIAAGTTGLYLVPDSQYYQLNIGSRFNTNNEFLPVDATMQYYVDNIRIARLPDRVPETLFSWETPDDPLTTEINEQYEGWREGFHPNHTHSLVTEGATHGNTALQIHRVDTTENNATDNFRWGSQFTVSGTTPELQEVVDLLKSKILAADIVAFDVTFNPDEFDGSPTYTQFGVHFSDNTNFFNVQSGNFNLVSMTVPTTFTVELPVTSFHTPETDPTLWRFLNVDEVFDDGDFFRIGISTNMDGLIVEGVQTPVDFQIDNFRLITLVPPAGENEGDFNADGVVDAADYVLWRKFNGTDKDLANDSSDGVTEDDYNNWVARFGASSDGGSDQADGSVPEPSAAALLLLATAGILGWVPRRRF